MILASDGGEIKYRPWLSQMPIFRVLISVEHNNKTINSRVGDTIDRFVKTADSKFECSEIVGRRFENIGDHAGYLRDGGCSEIIEVLATE